MVDAKEAKSPRAARGRGVSKTTPTKKAAKATSKSKAKSSVKPKVDETGLRRSARIKKQQKWDSSFSIFSHSPRRIVDCGAPFICNVRYFTCD